MTLKTRVFTGVKWISLTNIFKQILGVVTLVIFARLLTPEDFGVFAILMIFVGFLGMFTDMGISAALIHVKEPSERLLSSLFYLNVIVGIILFVLLSLLSGPISDFFDNHKLKMLLPLIAINFIIASFGVVQKALYEKAMNFKNLTLFESASVLIGMILGVTAAVYGLGVYSLILQTLSTTLISVILMWYASSWRPSRYFSGEEIKRVWSYSAHLSSFNVINYFARNADNFLIGKYLGSYSLGLYSLAYKIMLYPLQNISHVLIRILFPAFSLIQDDDEKFKKAYLRVIFFIALVSFPLMAGLTVTSDLLVKLFFGSKWDGLALVLTILAPVGMLQSVVTTVGSIYMAKGNTKEMFKIGSLNAIVTILFFVMGIPFGVEGVAFSYLLANIVMLYPNLMIAWRQIGLTIKEGMGTVFPVFYISLAMAFFVNLFKLVISGSAIRGDLQLFILILSGVLVYLTLIRWKYGELKMLVGELRR